MVACTHVPKHAPLCWTRRNSRYHHAKQASNRASTNTLLYNDDNRLRTGENYMMLSSSHPVGLPPPVSPFRPNLDALKLDISDDEDGLGVDTDMEKLWANGANRPPSPDGGWALSASTSPAPAMGLGDLDSFPTRNEAQEDLPSDDDSPARPSPRPRAGTLASSSTAIPSPSAAPAPPANRQFTRAASQPSNILGGSPTQRPYSPDAIASFKSGAKRPLVSVGNKALPSRSGLPEVTPLTTRKPLLSASAGKFLSRGGHGRISPPRRVLVKEGERDNEEGETEDEDRAPARAFPIAPRTSERNSLLRPRKESTPETQARSLASFGRSASSPDGMLNNRRKSPTMSPIESPYAPEHNPPYDSPTFQQNQISSSSAAAASTSSLSSTASTRAQNAASSVKARFMDWRSSIGSWSKSSKSRGPIPNLAGRPSLESLHRAMGGDSARPSIDNTRGSFERPSLDTVRPALNTNVGMPPGSTLETIRASADSGKEDASEDEEHRNNMGPGMTPDDDRPDAFRYESEEAEPMSAISGQSGPPRVYVTNGTRGHESRSASAAGWNDRERAYQADRPGTSSGYYSQSQSQQPQQPQLRAVQHAHEHVRRTSDTLRAVPETPVSSIPASLRHRRSPTAPSPPTSTIIASVREKEKENRVGQTWAAGQDPRTQDRADAAGVGGSYGADVGGYGGMGREEGKAMERDRERLREVENRRVMDMRERDRDRDERERDRGEREREVRSGSGQGLATAPQSVMQTPASNAAKRDRFICNKLEYTVVDCIGRGGSSKVYKVISPANKVYALKRVRLDSKVDEETMRGYVNEMQLLKRLDGNERIIKLVDSQAHGKGNRYLMMVMELGEIDLAKLLQERQGQLLQPHWIAIYWQQMLEAVQTIHEEKIVHSDLKPANFVLVKGSLKLIDFGIAKAIANDTTNIQREHQVGTLNYMSPESIEETQTANGRRLKLGRASDVWSLGCILYQMIYGRPPFYAIPGPVPKLRAISDPNHVIDYPALSIPTVPNSEKDGAPKQIPEWATPVPPDVIDSLRGCLTRDPKQRRTIPELLDDPWLRSWRHTSGGGEAPKLKENEAIVNEAWLKQIIEHASREAMENGALDEDAVAQMAQNLLPALRLANTKHPAYKQFC